MSETTQQLLVTIILYFTALFQPDDCDTIQGLQLFRLVHTLEDDFTLVRECELEWTLFCNYFSLLLSRTFSQQVHPFKNFLEQ